MYLFIVKKCGRPIVFEPLQNNISDSLEVECGCREVIR